MGKDKLEAPGWMVIGAVRYATGRMTYIVSQTVDWIVANWDSLDEHTRAIIRQDLEEAFDHDDQDRRREKTIWRTLGHDCDRQTWERVRKLWRKQKAGPEPR